MSGERGANSFRRVHTAMYRLCVNYRLGRYIDPRIQPHSSFSTNVSSFCGSSDIRLYLELFPLGCTVLGVSLTGSGFDARW